MMSRGLIASTAAVAVLALAAPASAAHRHATAKPKAKSVKASVTLYMPDAFFVLGAPVTVPGRSLHVGGVVRPYVPGQWVTVHAYLGSRLIKTDQLRVKPSINGKYGRFTETLSSPDIGGVSVHVDHARTSRMQGFKAQRGFSALDENIGFGSLGRFVLLMQQRLAALRIYIPQTGVYDQGMGLAVDAYHRLLGWGTSQVLDHATMTWLLNGWGQFKVRDPGDGRHAEGDLTHQLLALINGSQVDVIYPISSGKPSTPTILGEHSFRVYRRDPGYLPDGMYFSSFFTGGYAIHGYNPAPDYPASHGCMRLPIVDAIPVFNWLNFNDIVDTYY
jgi:L,D-transpeptidase-like protein